MAVLLAVAVLIGISYAWARIPRAALHGLGLLAVVVALLMATSGTAQAADSMRVDVRVWQHAGNAGEIRVGASPADGSWPAPAMIPLPLDDGVSRSGRYRYGDIDIAVEWRVGAAPVAVEVRVWQHVVHEREVWISACGSLGSWRTLGTVPLELDGRSGPEGCYRAGGVTLAAPLPDGGARAPLRYRLDPAGEATRPGSYAFLTAPVASEITTYEGLREDAASVRIGVDENGELTYTFYTAPRASVITTYEGLRRDAATLRVNAAAADGASSDGLFSPVEAGHLIEWFWRHDCFVRYRVTGVAEADASASYREFGVRPETYVFQGCQSGSLPADGTTAAFSAAPEMPLAHLGGLVVAAGGLTCSPEDGPPALLVPTVTTVVPGDRGVVTLEWAGGPEGATRWLYRLRAAGSGQWSPWTDIPHADATVRRHRVGELDDGSLWLFQVRGVAGTLAGEPSESVEGRVPTFDANGIPRLDAGWGYAAQLSEGGTAWRLGKTVVDIPAGMRISARVDAPLLDPAPPFEQSAIDDADSGSTLWIATDFGAECARSVHPSPSGRDVGALLDRIVASARVQIDAPPWLAVAATGERGVVSLRWLGGPHDATGWEYRLRGPYPCQMGSGCDDSRRPELPWGEWTMIPASDAKIGTHLVGGLPDLAAWDFQVRAIAGNVAGAETYRVGAPAVVGSDGIPQVHDFSYRAGGGRTWRLGDSPTVIDVPGGLDVWVSVGFHPDGMFNITDAATGSVILVNAETAEEVEFGSGTVSIEPPCGPTGERHSALFEQVRASIRLQPTAR